MKIIIGEFEVEVKAKGIAEREKYNKDDLEYFLNELSLVYQEASMFNEGQGYQAYARNYKKKSDDIFMKLNEMGAYDKHI